MQKRWTDGLYMHESHWEACWRRCDGVGLLCWLHCWGFIQNWRHISSSLRLVGPSFIFQQDNDPKHTSDMKKESDGVLCQMTWPPHWPKPNWDGLGWDGQQCEGERANKCSASLGTPLRLLENHFRWLLHEAHRENAKSVQSRNQSKGWLFWRI